MADFTKHRGEAIKVGVDFVDTLNSGDAVANVVGVAITKESHRLWTDVSSQFGSPVGTLNGTIVEFTLGAAASGAQEEGNYRIKVEITTNDSEILILTPTLLVTDAADPSAPQE